MYDTVFEPRPKKPEYRLNLENNFPTVVKQKIIPDNNNIEIYNQNLGIMKGDVKLFNYVGKTIMRYRQDDFNYKSF